MKINQSQIPIIDPPKDPSIMVDRGAEKRLKSVGVQSPVTKASSGAFNPNSKPSSGGLVDGFIKHLNAVNAAKNQPKNDRKTKQLLYGKKSSGAKSKIKTWIPRLLILFFFASVMGGVEEKTENIINDLDTTTSYTSNEVAIEAKDGLSTTNCFTIELPSTSEAKTYGGHDVCRLFFKEGYASSSSNYTSTYSGNELYESLDSYYTYSNQTLIKNIVINEIEVGVYEGIADETTDYAFWVNDLGLRDTNDEKIAIINFIMLTANEAETEQAEKIIQTVKIITTSGDEE